MPNVKSIIGSQYYYHYREIVGSVSFICMCKDTYIRRLYLFKDTLFVWVDRAQAGTCNRTLKYIKEYLYSKIIYRVDRFNSDLT